MATRSNSESWTKGRPNQALRSRVVTAAVLFPAPTRTQPAPHACPSCLAGVVKESGRQLIEPPESGWIIGVVAVRAVALPTWSVDAPLFTREESRLDLTLLLTIVREGGQWKIELDDLHVM